MNFGKPAPGGNEHGIVSLLVEQLVKRNCFSHDDVGLKVNAHPTEIFDFLANDVFWQSKFRNAVDKYSADFMQSFQNRYVMSLSVKCAAQLSPAGPLPTIAIFLPVLGARSGSPTCPVARS